MMTTDSAPTLAIQSLALAILAVTCVCWAAHETPGSRSAGPITSTAGLEREPLDDEPDGHFELGFGLDLEPAKRFEIENPWGSTRVEHADVARMSITTNMIRDGALPHCVSGPTATGWRLAIGERRDPQGTIDLVVRVPRATTVIVNGIVDVEGGPSIAR